MQFWKEQQIKLITNGTEGSENSMSLTTASAAVKQGTADLAEEVNQLMDEDTVK